jgi:hypothetical protein
MLDSFLPLLHCPVLQVVMVTDTAEIMPRMQKVGGAVRSKLTQALAALGVEVCVNTAVQASAGMVAPLSHSACKITTAAGR